MKKHILQTAVLAAGTLIYAGTAYACANNSMPVTMRDNNTDGIAQYQQSRTRYDALMTTRADYKPQIYETGNTTSPAHHRIGGDMTGRVSDIEPAAGAIMKEAHEDTLRYNR